MQDPAVAEKMKQMQEAMSRPEVQQQMAEMQAYMQNQQVQQRMQVSEARTVTHTHMVGAVDAALMRQAGQQQQQATRTVARWVCLRQEEPAYKEPHSTAYPPTERCPSCLPALCACACACACLPCVPVCLSVLALPACPSCVPVLAPALRACPVCVPVPAPALFACPPRVPVPVLAPRTSLARRACAAVLCQALRDDPEFKQMFEEIQSGGMGALMKYMNDPKASNRQTRA